MGVVVPAHDEEELIGSCLNAVVRATRAVPVVTAICVVADACHDGTTGRVAQVAGRLGVDIHTEVIDARAVGTARRAGAEVLLDHLGSEGTWLATTDADSEVPAHWLMAQMGHAWQGADAVAGVVAVADWSERLSHLRPLAERHYRRLARHVHGANLGIRAESYRAVGGFARVRHDEDVLLVRALTAADARMVWADDLVVSTSARRVGRAPAGFAGFLTRLESRVGVAADGGAGCVRAGTAALPITL